MEGGQSGQGAPIVRDGAETNTHTSGDDEYNRAGVQTHSRLAFATRFIYLTTLRLRRHASKVQHS